MNVQNYSADQARHVVPRVAEAGSSLSRIYRGLLASAGFTAFLLVSAPALALAVAPPLGTAAGYTVLGTNPSPTVGTVTCVSSGPLTTITGNVGSTFTSITPGACTITGTTTAPVLGSVVTDFNSAYSALDSLNPTCDAVIPTVTSTLAPGVYCSAAGTTIGAGVTFTLSGTASDIWVFKVGTGGTGALTGTSFTVTMGGTAKDYNVYWWTKEAATLTDSTFKGTILSGTAITTTRTNYVGRVMAKTDVSVTNGPMSFFVGAPPTVTVTKISNGDVGTFNFTGNNGFASHNITTATSGVGVAGATQTLTAVGTITTIIESAPPAGFALASIACTGLGAGGTATPNIGARSVTLDANATAVGAAIACTFTNTFNVPPTLIKTFTPASIGAGGGSLLTITLSNNNATAATLSSALIDDTSLIGVTTVGVPTTTCGGTAPTVTATSVTLPIGATIPGGAPGTCTVTVNVTSAVVGGHINTLVAGALATDKGSNAAPATATLTVTAGAVATTTLSTAASASVTLGGAVSDTATLSGGVAPTGTITFNLYGPNDATCALASRVFTSPATAVVSGNGIYSSPTFTPGAIGTYYWIANYSGDGSNASFAGVCNAAGESVIVTAVPPVATAGIPTLSEWAMIMLASLLAIVGFAAMRRQAR